MARLTRKNIKVFAGNATNNGVFGSLQAENPVTTTNVEQIQSLPAWNVGWDSATMTSEKLPPLEEFQGIQYVTTYQQAYLMQEGMPEWASTVTYYKGSLAKEVTSNGFRIYCSLTDNNTGNLLSDTSNWKKVMDSDDLYAFDNTVVHKTGNETITGVKTFNGNNRIVAIQNSTVTYNTTPSSSALTDISFRDKNGYEMGILEHVRHSNNDTSIHIAAKGADGNWSSNLLIGRRADGTSYTSAPTPTAGDNSTNIATTAFVKAQGYAVNSNVVHLTSNETINGVKTFSQDVNVKNDVPAVYLQENDVVKGTNPTNEQAWRINGQDSVGNDANHRIGEFTTRLTADGTTWSGIIAYKNEANSNVSSSIRVYYPASGSPYTYAPTPTDTTSTSSTQIATTGWVNSTGNNVVHKTSNETINGVKTFFGEIIRANQNITKGTAPTSGTNTVIGFADKNNATLGNVYHRYEANKNSRTILQATKANASGNTDTASISICYPANGNPYGEAPASDAVNSILTTVSINKSANGKLKLGNGFMIQWFTQHLSSSVSFPTPFDNGCVFVAVVDTQANTMGVSNITTTGFEYRQSYDLPRACRVFAIGY